MLADTGSLSIPKWTVLVDNRLYRRLAWFETLENMIVNRRMILTTVMSNGPATVKS